MKILYFAWVRQMIGKAEEDVELPPGIASIAELAAWLHSRGDGYGEAFADLRRLRAARNQEHASFDDEVSDADEIAFFPPVTGG